MQPVTRTCSELKFMSGEPYHKTVLAAMDDVLEHTNTKTYYYRTTHSTEVEYEEGSYGTICIYADGFCDAELSTDGHCTFCLQQLASAILYQCRHAMTASVSNPSCFLRYSYSMGSFDVPNDLQSAPTPEAEPSS